MMKKLTLLLLNIITIISLTNSVEGMKRGKRGFSPPPLDQERPPHGGKIFFQQPTLDQEQPSTGGKRMLQQPPRDEAENYQPPHKKIFLIVPGGAIKLDERLTKLEKTIITLVIESLRADGYQNFHITKISNLSIEKCHENNYKINLTISINCDDGLEILSSWIVGYVKKQFPYIYIGTEITIE